MFSIHLGQHTGLLSLKAFALWAREKQYYSLLQVPAAFIYAQVKSHRPPFFCLFPGVEDWSVSEGWKQNCFSSTNPLLGLLFRPKSQQFLSQCKLESSQLETLVSPVEPRDAEALAHSTALSLLWVPRSYSCGVGALDHLSAECRKEIPQEGNCPRGKKSRIGESGEFFIYKSSFLLKQGVLLQVELVTALWKPFCWRKKKNKSDRSRWDQSKRRLGSDRPTTEKGTKRLKTLRDRQPAAGTDTHQDSHQYTSTGKCPAGPLVVPEGTIHPASSGTTANGWKQEPG